MDISVADKTSSISISAEIEEAKDGDIIKYTLTGPDGASISTSSIKVTENKATDRFEVQDAKFWWPVGFGEQPLYTIEAQLIREVSVLDVIWDPSDFFFQGVNIHRQSRKIGLRTVSLVQRPLVDQPGTSFFFEINGVPIFSSGSNWCPADHFVPRVTPERYRTLLQMVVDGNQNMLRSVLIDSTPKFSITNVYIAFGVVQSMRTIFSMTSAMNLGS